MTEGSTPVEIFCSYAHEDKTWVQKLETHLSLLKRQGLISLWHDRLIAPGIDWTKTIDTHLETVSVILLLVSADFFASDYCCGIEMKRAIARQEAGEAWIIPILVRPTDWKNAPFKHLQILPSNGKPITQWRDRDAAFTDVVGGIRNAIESLPHFSTQAHLSSRPPFWHVPLARNPFFTGREEYLRQISALLKEGTPASAVAPLALCGLGGIGKTQIVIEYAYRHRCEYQAVFWVEADSYETLVADFVAIAAVLKLVGTNAQLLLPKKSFTPGTSKQVVPVQPLFIIKQQEGLVKLFRVDQQTQSLETQAHPENSQELSYLISSVKHWFDARTDWLLILDNVEDLRVIKEFLPPTRGGHVLLATRSQSLGELAQSVAIEKMELEESTRFLLRRMKLTQLTSQPPSAYEAAHTQAWAIAQELDNVPLALDQAGAYIEETGCGLAGYLVRYRQRRAQLLQRRGGENPEHPEPIATTVLLCFEKVERDNPAAANILLLCSFLHPNGVPEELIASAHFDPLLQSVAEDLLVLDAAIEILRRFSLLHRISDTKTLVVHRLVQVILQDAMDGDAQRQWTERTVRLVNQCLSDGQAATWQAYFPHIQSCAELIKQQKLCIPEAAQLLHQSGAYLKDQIQYEQAIQFFLQAIAIWEQLLQQDTPALMISLDALAEIYVVRGEYSEALPLLQRTLSLREQALGGDHFKLASNLDNLAVSYFLLELYGEAERLFKRTLAIRAQVLGEEHLDLVNTLNNLALLYMKQERYVEAEPLLQRILAICTKVLGPNHLDTNRARKNYIDLLQRTGRNQEAETLAANSNTQSLSDSLWNLPYLRNPFFTGRGELLDRLHQHFMLIEEGDPAVTRRAVLIQPLALKGLGGIGKTQIAVEYAYRNRNLYTHTLWVNANNEETIITSFAMIAQLLPRFAAKNEMDQRQLVEAMQHWLEQCKQRWLLIFDGADDFSLVQKYLPQRGNGSILLTTRANASGSLAASIEVDTMSWMEGTELLLRRAQHFNQVSDEERNKAGNIVVALDFLPLALDQAGAYIEETRCSFGDYLQIYRDHRKELLALKGLPYVWLYPFREVERANPAAAELLRLCAFLAPNSIPEDLIRHGAAHWSPLLQQVATDSFAFNEMLAGLLRFSLVKRSVEARAFSIHRLTQMMQMDMIESEVQRQWSERVIRAVNEVFPRDVEDVTTWAQCLQYLEQAQACATLIRQYEFTFIQAADILSRTGVYLCKQTLYSIAESLLEHALHINEQHLELWHPEMTQSLNNLALCYIKQEKYTKAELLYQRALHTREQALGPDHPDVATSLNNLAELYQMQEKYEQARPLYQSALNMWERLLGPKYCLPHMRTNMMQARELLDGHKAWNEFTVGSTKHPSVATSLDSLANLLWQEGQFAKAELLYQRGLSIREQALGPDHPDLATSLNNLAKLYNAQGRYAQAEPLFQRALAICEKALGDHPDLAQSLSGLAKLYYLQGKYTEAEPLFWKALDIRQSMLGFRHSETSETTHDMAQLWEAQGDNEEARTWYTRALEIRWQALGWNHPKTTETRQCLIALLHTMGQHEQAAQLEVTQSEP